MTAGADGTRAESPRPPAGPGDLSEEKPATPSKRTDDPLAKPPAGPGKFPEPGDDAYVTDEDLARAAFTGVDLTDEAARRAALSLA